MFMFVLKILILMKNYCFTRGGPIIIPFHLLIVISFSLSKPHDTVPSLAPPFCPSSNSSSSLKLLGITFLNLKTQKKETKEIKTIFTDI